MNEFSREGVVQCAGARVNFSCWRFRQACHFNPGTQCMHLKLSGLPPLCWHPEALSFFHEGIGTVVDVKIRKRLGNGLLHVVIFLDVRKDLSISDYLVFLHV